MREHLIGRGRSRSQDSDPRGLLPDNIPKNIQQASSLISVEISERTTFQKKKIILCSPTSEDMRQPLQEGDKNKYFQIFFPPLGLTLVGQHLVNAGYDVSFFDGNFTGIYKEELIEAVVDHQDSLAYVGFYLSILQIKDFLELGKKIKDINLNIPIVAGGPFPAVFPRKVMESELIDIACIGDGAEPSVCIADHFNQKMDLHEIPNICFREHDKVITKSRTHRDTLNKDNFIKYDNFFNVADYTKRFSLYLMRGSDPSVKRAVPILTGLGCSYKCTFCENALLGHKHFSMTAEDIVEQIVYYKEKHNIDAFSFFDEDFFFDKKRLFRLIELMENLPFRIKWGTQSRANYFKDSYINENILTRLENTGLVRVAIGVESGSPRMLKKIKKGISREMVLGAAKIARNSSVYFSYSFIIHLPGESREDFGLTYDLIDKLEKIKKNSFVSAIHDYFSYPGTPLSVEVENRVGFKIEEQLKFEDFTDYNLEEYNRLINPIKRDAVKDCISYHYKYLHRDTGIGDGISTSFLRDVDSRRTIKTYAIRLFTLVGKFRNRHNFFSFPIEIYLVNAWFWLKKTFSMSTMRA